MRPRTLFPSSALALGAALLAPGFAAFVPSTAAGGGTDASRPRASPSAVLARADERIETTGGGGVPPARGVEGADETLAPYFVVVGSEDGEQLPLEETSADVRVAGVIAQVSVHQVFRNRGQQPIEATYVFPASTRAAVHGMRMRIGERTIEARIDRRAQARAAYEQARQEGKRASLLEQQRPNVFTMSVANVMPGDRIEVQLEYSELLVPDDGVYELVYPTVVGPRYGGGADPVSDAWIANPYLHEGEKEPYRFAVEAHLETGIPLQELSSPSHEITVDYRSPSSADVRLASAGGGTHDFVLRWRLAGERIQSGALVFEGGGERFFLLMLEPPARPTSAQVPPREYVFLVDVSGSMHGFPLDTAKELVRNLIGALRPTDLFDLVMFSGGSAVMSPGGSVPATPDNVSRALAMLGGEQGGGGTELLAGLRAAYGIPRAAEGVARSVVVVTDGYVGVEAQAFKLVRDRLGEANLFAFGIGSSVNRGLVEGLARAGQGEPFVVSRPELATAEAEKLRQYVQQPVLTDIEVRFPGLDVREVAPARVPDLMARRPIVVFGKLGGDGEGAIEVSGVSGGGRVTQRVPVSLASAKAENEPLRLLWARRWVETLDDELALAPAAEIEDAITDLGLTYGLLTRFTSFVAVDSEVVNAGGNGATVAQPLPLPDGVSDLAVGGAASRPFTALRRAMKAQAPSPLPAGGGSPMLETRGRAEPAPGWSPDRAGASTPDRGSPGPGVVRVARVTGASLSSEQALVALVRRTLAASACPSAAAARLTLVVDRSGAVVGVEAADAASRALAACLSRSLVGQRVPVTVAHGLGRVELVFARVELGTGR